ncbi:unnamed protein product [Spirodela intermedia]|uniref:Uncharacterized protein n=1 Tax=Spirodela intermedia TaxID=51605 RepID=A0A7I8LDF7_SPIIN|nr:unnamed protein product [Spirodela intermedia]
MVYTYTPAYYSSVHETITTLCKNILPFSLKSRRLISQSEQKLAKRQSDNLKWQQESFHRILNLIGLQKEGIVSDQAVASFRSYLLETLVSSPADQETPGVVRDKLLFLQELLYAKCISSDEYHSSKRPLLQRLALQGVEIDCRDVIAGGHDVLPEEEWSEIELRDKERPAVDVKQSKTKHLPSIKGAMSFVGISTGKVKETTSCAASEPLRPVDLNRRTNWEAPSLREKTLLREGQKGIENRSILAPVSLQNPSAANEEKVKKKSFRAIFHKEQREGNGKTDLTAGDGDKTTPPRAPRMHWGLDGLKKWKRSACDDESTAPYLPPGERSDDAASLGEGPDTKRIKKKIHSDGAASDFFIDKVLGENIKKELSRIQSELHTTNPNLTFSDDQIEAISTRLPVDKADLKRFFPKSWCDRYGDVVLEVVKKEFKDHVGEMETLRNTVKERRQSSEKWVAFDENDENFATNLFLRDQTFLNEEPSRSCFANNPFYDDDHASSWAPR